MAEALAISPKTILQGKRELQAPANLGDRELGEERQRRPGGGRKPILEKHPQLRSLIEQIVDPATRGDPMKPLRWVSKSLPHIVDELARHGYSLSLTTVSNILHAELGFGSCKDYGRPAKGPRIRIGTRSSNTSIDIVRRFSSELSP